MILRNDRVLAASRSKRLSVPAMKPAVTRTIESTSRKDVPVPHRSSKRLEIPDDDFILGGAWHRPKKPSVNQSYGDEAERVLGSAMSNVLSFDDMEF